MKHPYLYFEAKLIKEYMKEKGGFLPRNNYELLTAIILRAFFKSINDIDYKIGFSLKDKYVSFYEKNQDLVNFDSFKNFFEKHKNEDLDSDFLLIPRNPDEKKFQPIVLQAKRFGHFQKDKSTESLITFLKKITKKYSKTETILVLFFDGHKGLDIQNIHNYLKSIDFPFSRLMFIQINKNEHDEWKMYIGEVFPSFGYNEYDPKEMTSV